MKKLVNWVFIYNVHTENWQATLRDNYNMLYSDIGNSKVLKSSNIDTLIELIIKTDGDIKKIKKLLNGK